MNIGAQPFERRANDCGGRRRSGRRGFQRAATDERARAFLFPQAANGKSEARTAGEKHERAQPANDVASQTDPPYEPTEITGEAPTSSRHKPPRSGSDQTSRPYVTLDPFSQRLSSAR